jgi:glutamyl-tRNA synthetase
MTTQADIEDFVYNQALENAISFGGKANMKPILGKTISKFPQIKKDFGHYQNLINNIVLQVNQMDAKEQETKLIQINPDFFNKKQETKEKTKKEGLPDLPGLDGEFIGRFAPAPSGYLHIGHAYNIIYNHEYKKKYGGKFILRFEDTNPENISIENYDKIIEDVKWLTQNDIDEIHYQSDRVDIYYKYLRQLIETNHAYICECEIEKFKDFHTSSTPCPHRELPVEEQIKKYEKFFQNKYKDKDAVIRFKADLQNKNPALRDFPIARQNSTPHAKVGKKYKLWPMYNFCVSVDDSLMGITYIVRGKDSEINGIKQDMIKDALGLKKSKFYHIGITKFTDIEIGKTPIRKKIEEGIYTGWDDPRVPTLISFRKRGFKSEAFKNMIIAKGISKRDSRITEKEFFKNINYHNKQILEKEANRRFFVIDPIEVKIKNISTKYPQKEIELPKHPEFKDRGYRKFPIQNTYYIEKIDFNNIEKEDTIRLMHFANFKITNKTKNSLELEYISKEYDKNLNLKRNIHFLPANQNYYKPATIIMQDAQKLKGLCENLDNPKPSKSIQFERFGFVRFDSKKKDGSYLFYFTHR